MPNYGVTVSITDAPGTFKAYEIASGELAERLGKSYFHQLLADSYPIPGGGNIQVPIEGEGTVETPYLIYNGRQMYELARRINSGYVNAKGETVAAQYRANVKLMADIDLNAGYDSLALKMAFESGFSHAHDIATEHADDSVGLHYCFASGFYDYYYDWSFERAIDHILVRGDGVSVKRFERYSPEYYLPISDHSPAFIDWEFE